MSTGAKAFVIVFAAIIFLFIIGDRFNMKADVKEFHDYVMELDTTAVIEIRSSSQKDPLADYIYLRNGADWIELTSDSVIDRSVEARSILSVFQQLKIKRTMGSLLEFGDRYHLRANTMRTITFVDVDGNERSLNIGSDTFGASGDRTWTYVHIPGGTEVYAVEVALWDVLSGTTHGQ
ncbi:MAG: hypothetical protein WAR83_07040 [Flavobacteriales bacterium]